MFFYSGTRYSENASAMQQGQYLYVRDRRGRRAKEPDLTAPVPAAPRPAPPCPAGGPASLSHPLATHPHFRRIAKKGVWLLVNVLLLVALLCATIIYISDLGHRR